MNLERELRNIDPNALAGTIASLLSRWESDYDDGSEHAIDSYPALEEAVSAMDAHLERATGEEAMTGEERALFVTGALLAYTALAEHVRNQQLAAEFEEPTGP